MKEDIQKALEKFSRNKDVEETQDNIFVNRRRTSDPMVKKLIKFIIDLVEEVVPDGFKIPEMYTSCSCVHPLVKSIFGLSVDHICRCSNVKNDTDKDLKWRPDYKVDKYIKSTKGSIPLLYGEIKTAGSSDEAVNKDIYHIAVLSKLALQDHGLNYIISIMAVGSNVKFFMMQRENSIFYFNEITEVIIPTTINNIVFITSHLNNLYMVSQLAVNCGNLSEIDEEIVSKTLPIPLYKTLLKKSKSSIRSAVTTPTTTPTLSTKPTRSTTSTISIQSSTKKRSACSSSNSSNKKHRR